MSGDPAATPAPSAPRDADAGVELCVLLACFAGRKRAGKIRRQLDKQLGQSGDAVLDEVVLKVDAKHKAQVHDPRRTVTGTLTPVLTWGLFGLLAGGLEGFAFWGVIGGIFGGLAGYYMEGVVTKDQLKRIGAGLPADSSAIAAYVRGRDPERILASPAALEPVTASVAAVAADLSAQVRSDPPQPAEASSGARPTATALTMLLVRFAGQHAARKALGESGESKDRDQTAPQVELFIESDEHGRRRVIVPTTGTAAFAKSDVISWGLCGVAYGLIVGFAGGDGGVLGGIESGLVVGVAWGIFGLVAGALYGMWAGRGVSARRLKGLGGLVPPDSSLAVAWAEGSPSQQTVERWAVNASQRLALRFNSMGDGAALDV